jgi:hypothetical protein
MYKKREYSRYKINELEISRVGIQLLKDDSAQWSSQLVNKISYIVIDRFLEARR